jgi:hypothetical protein
VLEWTEAIYASVYAFVLATPLLLRSQWALRRMATLGLFATAIVTLIYLTVPLVAPPRPFEPDTILGRLLMLERTLANTVAAFPAFHVVWSLIAAEAWASRSRSWGLAGWTWASLIAVSCLTTGMHALVDLIAAAAFYIVLRIGGRLWDGCRGTAEAIANSWHEWHWRGVRLINHGFYAATAAVIGMWVSGTLGGANLMWPLVTVHLFALAGAGLWAQRLEGSSKLSRPFGYFGSVLGTAAGCAVLALVGGNAMLVLALLTVAAPWVQAIGRLRCLVQGCCHGHEAPIGVGIRYWRSKSRVCVLADLRGVPLHPTPLYSILANIVIGMVLARLWSLGSPLGIVIGFYLLLSGAARFVEEAHRGEPQTPVIWGLRLYQWLAMIAFVVGIAFTAVPGRAPADLSPGFDLPLLVAGLALGVLTGLAMGVDFPGSSRRFARLAPQ